MTRDEVFVDKARGYIGTRWKHQGRSRTGLDCIGLVVLSLRDCGVDAPLAATYGRMADYFELKSVLCEFATRIGKPHPGALLLFMQRSLLHMAICSGPRVCIQALNTVGRVVEGPANFDIKQAWGIKWPS